MVSKTLPRSLAPTSVTTKAKRPLEASRHKVQSLSVGKWLKNWLLRPAGGLAALATIVAATGGAVKFVDDRVAAADRHELASGYEHQLAAIKSDDIIAIGNIRSTLDELRGQNARLQSTLDAERSRIVFTVEQETNSLDRRTLVLPAERIPNDYKMVETEGFAVPQMAGESSWQWHEDTEHVAPENPSDGVRLDLLFPKPVDLSQIPDALKLAGGIKVVSFADPTPISYTVHGKQVTVTPQVVFELLRWADFDQLMSIQASAAARSVLEFGARNLERFAGNLKVGANCIAVTLANDLLPPEKALRPESQASRIFEAATAKDLATTLVAADPKIADEVVAAYAARFPGKKVTELQTSLKEQRDQWTKMTDGNFDFTKVSVQLHAAPDQAYLQIFSRTLGNYLTIGGTTLPPPLSPVFDELGFGRDYFVIRGYVPVQQPDGRSTVKVYFLNIGIRSERGVYLIRYLIPGSGRLADIRNAQSMIHGFHIIE